MGAWVQVAWVGGTKVVPTFSRATITAPSRSTSGVARYRDHAAFGYIFRENARDMLNNKTTCRRPGRSSTCRRSADGMAHAEGRPHGGWVWAVPGRSSPHVQSHGKCVCMMWFTGWVVVRGRHEARVRGKHFGWDIDEFTRALNANGSGARGIVTRRGSCE